MDTISNLFVADDPMEKVGLPSLTLPYIVKSPAAIFVVAEATPKEFTPANVVIVG